MIRCKKCGYTNQNTAQKCVKCQTALTTQEPVNQASSVKGGSTQSDIKFNRPAWDAPVVEPTPPPVAPDSGKTMRRFVPSSTPCALVPLANDGEKELQPIPIKGEAAVLNRDMLDAGNTSISRKGHANLVYRDNSWWIENLTELKTTFIQVNKPVKLADGDIILLGDTMFRFKANS